MTDDGRRVTSCVVATAITKAGVGVAGEGLPKISIVVPAYNEERLLGESLERIRNAAGAIEERGWSWELIVCDNNSTDRTAAIAREAGARVVFEPINQIARARNRGAEVARGEWLMFVDADSHPSWGLFSAACARMESGGVIACGAQVYMDCEAAGPLFFLSLWNWISVTLRWMAGSFVFCRAEAFRKVGGFSALLFAGEELDLSRRLAAEGRRTGERIEILTETRLVTSARKMRLYSWGEFLSFFVKATLLGGRPLRRRENCAIWYDGRR